MPLELSLQFHIIIYSLLAGVLTGILFDAYRILRGFKLSKTLVMIEDVLFWILCALIIFTFLLYTNFAFLGIYVYIFIFIALALYFKLFSSFVVTIEKNIGKQIWKIFRVLFKNIIYPFKLFLLRLGNKN